MSKKKAIKLVTASAIAASAFAAVAPTQSQAATSINTVVANAQKAMKAPFDKYYQTGITKKTVSAVTVQRYITAGQKAYTDASAAVKKAGGKYAKTNQAKLDSYKKYLDRSKAYVSALNEISLIYKQADGAVKAENLGDLKSAEAVLKNASNKGFVGISKVYGPATRDVLKATFTRLSADKLAKVQYTIAKVTSKVESVNAINATTVEVTFKDAVNAKNLDNLKFTIDGLTVTNAAVKQTNDKVVVLTTSVQDGAKEYKVKLNGDTLDFPFKGRSAVIPTSVKLVSTSLQSKVGNQVTLKADIGQKVAGVAVTFNVDAPTDSLNKDQVVEVLTNADGVAEYTYTQYAAGTDSVAVYPTGAPSVRAMAKVFWGKDAQLALEEVTSGNALSNGEKKVYKVKYTDPTTGAPIANAYLNVALQENINTPYQNQSTAIVTDLNNGTSGTPSQTDNVFNSVNYVQIKTDANGVASFTVTGTNTSATPIVFVDGTVADKATSDYRDNNNRLDSTELQVWGQKVTFAGAQINNVFTLTPDTNGEGATGLDNGRKYTLKVTNKDGKVFAGGTVNVGLNELLDNNLSTNTPAYLLTKDSNGNTVVQAKQLSLTLDSKGEATFYVAVPNGYDNSNATPVVWIDQNDTPNSQVGTLENGEPTLIGKTTNFQASRVSSASIDVDKSEVYGGDTAKFNFEIDNQSGNPYLNGTAKVTYEVINTGAIPLQVGGDTIAVGKTLTITKDLYSPNDTLVVTGVGTGLGSVKVNAHATTSAVGYLDAGSATASLVKTNDGVPYGKQVTSTVKAVDGTKLTLANGLVLNYDKQNLQLTGNNVDQPFFASHISEGDTITFTKRATQEGKDTFNIITDDQSQPTPVTDLAFKDADTDENEVGGKITFTQLAGQTYKVFFGNTELTPVAGAYSIADDTKFTGQEIKVTATKVSGGVSKSIDKTISIVDDKTGTQAATAALSKINDAAKAKVWDGVTVEDFAKAGVKNVTSANFTKVKSAVQDARALNGSSLTVDEIQKEVDSLK